LTRKTRQFKELVEREREVPTPTFNVTASVLNRIKRENEGYDLKSMGVFACFSAAIVAPCLPYVYVAYSAMADPLYGFFRMAGGLL
jgi:hypothetical protein